MVENVERVDAERHRACVLARAEFQVARDAKIERCEARTDQAVSDDVGGPSVTPAVVEDILPKKFRVRRGGVQRQPDAEIGHLPGIEPTEDEEAMRTIEI